MKDPVQARQIDTIWDEGLAPGVFDFADKYSSIIYMCPCGCEQLMSLPIATGEKIERHWQWNGDREKPTLQPSIKVLDGCRFHGYLTDGVWTFCSDSGAK